jgi:hypothetical protein
MFRRGVAEDEAWAGVVTRRKRAVYDGSGVYFRIVVALDDGSTRNIRVGRALWKSLNEGDRLVKQSGGRLPAKAG